MKYDNLKNTINLLEEFENENALESLYADDISGFTRWIAVNYQEEIVRSEPD